MDKTTMPEPVAYQDDDGSCWELTSHPELMTPLITTTQAEAYAAAKVREALEEAIAAVETCRTTGTIRHGTVSDCIEAIRALFPSTPARPESER